MIAAKLASNEHIRRGFEAPAPTAEMLRAIRARLTAEAAVMPVALRFQPPPHRPPITTRHLLYHIYPVAGNGAWQHCVDELCQRLELFNGQVIVAIATDPPSGRKPDPTGPDDPGNGHIRQMGQCDSAAAVRERFGPQAQRIEFLELENDPSRREVASLIPLLSRVQTDDPTHATLYAQGKGVTYHAGHICHHWGQALTELYFDYWPVVADVLADYPVAGAFLKDGRGWPAHQSNSNWHYSGSWFWFRNAELFQRQWQTVDRFWGGIESYPSLHFHSSEAGPLFHRTPVSQMNLYDANYWRIIVEPERHQFKASHAHRYLRIPAGSPGQLNHGCGPFYRDGWLNTDVFASDKIKPDVIVPLDGPIPFPDSHFDRAYNGHLLEHVPWERVPWMLGELKRVVKPGGLVCTVGPDFERAIERLRADPSDASVLHLREVAEDGRHYQCDSPDPEQAGARHQWNMYESRVATAMQKAGFLDVRPLPFTPEALDGWPVVDFTATQCAVVGRVP